MKKKLISLLVCPDCRAPLDVSISSQEGDQIREGTLSCPNGHTYPISNFIPRLVKSDSYVESFSFEWHKFSRVQLDIFSGTTESADTFVLKTGFDRELIRGKLVLDVGMGAGRFSDVVSRWGGEVIGVDLSYAVDAAYENIGDRPNVHIVQADLFALPFRDEIFDLVFSIGVLHHTPDTRAAFGRLVPFVKPGGNIAIWLYAAYYRKVQAISTLLRKLTTKMPKRLVYYLASIVVPLYYIGPIRKIIFPIFQFSLHKNPRWRWLDTFDWYTPRYVWKHSYPEIFQWFREASLKDITPLEPPVAMRGRK